MEAGRELDMLIAEQVMGLCTGKTVYVSDEELTAQHRADIHADYVKSYGEEPNADWLDSEAESRMWDDAHGDYPPKKCSKCSHGPHRAIPFYSTSIADAWLVVEKFRKGGGDHAAACITCHITDAIGIPDCCCTISGPSIAEVSAIAHDMPLAICLATLKAVSASLPIRSV